MSVVIQTNRTVDLDNPIRKTELPNLFVKGNDSAHEFNISVVKSGVAESLAAGSCSALFVNASKQTVVLSGSVSSNVATVTLNDACYAVTGRFYLVINASVGGVTQAVFYGVGSVAPGETTVVIDPDDIVPSLPELLAQVAACENATAAAVAATTLANTAADDAYSAATGADASAALADGAADAANAAAVLANTAADNADGAAAGADVAAADADDAAALANAAAALANTAADDADTAAAGADAAAATADDAADDANAAADAALAASTQLKALDQYDTYADMIAGVPSPVVGESVYAVGASYPYDIWIYMTSGWRNFGQITGPSMVSTATETDITGPLWGDGSNVRLGIAGTDFASPGGTVNVCDYGATGDGTTDDTAAINAAISAIEVGQTLFFPAGTYNTTEGIHITKEINVIMDGIINYVGAAEDVVVLQIDDSDGDDRFDERRLFLRADRSPISDWTDEDSISIKLVNCFDCEITIFEAYDSTIGAQLLGDDSGFGYNTIRLGYIKSNKIGLDIANSGSGWCNENLFLGGRFTVGSTAHPTLARYGVRLRSIDDGWQNDQNIFEKPCFEIGAPGGGVESIPVLCEKATGCRFNNCRMEGCGTVAMRESYQGGNYISITSYDHGYDVSVDNQQEDDALGSTVFLDRWKDLQKDRNYKIFDTGPLCKRAASYGDGNRIHIPGMLAIDWSDGSFQRAGYGIVYAEGAIYADSVIGVIVNTAEAKRFLIARDQYDYGSQVCVRPMDAEFNTLDGSGAKRYVSYATYYLGWQAAPALYCMGSEYNDDFYFEVTDDVKYAFIGIRRKTRCFTLYADKQATAFSFYDSPDMPNVAAAEPNHCTYEAGRRVVNVDPTASIAAWLCTDAGTCDTISTTCTADGSAVIVVASADDTRIGRYITVNGGDRRKIIKVDGTSITLDDTVAAGSGLAVVNYEPTWAEETNAAIAYDKLVFDSGPLYMKAAMYGNSASWSGHDELHIPGMCFWDCATPEMCKVYWGYIYHNYIRNNDGFVGVYIDTNVAKDFLLHRELPLGDSTVVTAVLCFDADMEWMDGSGSSLITSSAHTMSWNSTYLGYSGGTATADYDIHVDASVKYIYIGMQRYGNLVSAKIYSNVCTSAFSPYDAQGDPHVAIGPPDAGTHRVGERTTNDVPASGSPKGWLCTVAGTDTPISTTCTADDSAVVVVADATGLDKGQYISINSGATQQIVKVDGTSITMDSTVAAGSGLSFENVASTWVSEGNL